MANILIVDDDRHLIQYVRELLATFGYITGFVIRPEHLFARLEQGMPDLILMDVHMPDTDGISLLKRLKAHPIYHAIPVIMLTVEIDQRMLAKCFENGAVDFIHKPIKSMILKARVQAALETQKFIEEIQQQKKALEVRTADLNRANQKLRLEIMARRKAETALSKTHQALERKVEERTVKLKEANARLKGEVAERARAEADLKFSHTILMTQQEVSLDGILVVDEQGRMISFNHRFTEMWEIPIEIQDSRSDEKALQLVLAKLSEPQKFLAKVNYLYQHRTEKSHDEILLADGRTLDRYSAPMFGPGQQYYGRVWYFRDITAHKQAEELIKASLAEKELLLKEVYHRVKNNLQVISSLLYLQSQNVKDSHSIQLFKESESRVKSMALIHEKLYKSNDLARIDYGEYIDALVNHLRQTYADVSRKIAVKVAAANISLDIDIAIPCGLIINELVSNSLKHAFPPGTIPEGERGEIQIKMICDHLGEYGLKVSDNGIGFPSDFAIHNTQSLGMQIVNTLVEQLDGTIELHQGPETVIDIRFKEYRYNQRI